MKDILVAIIGAGPGGTTCAAMLEKLGIKSVIIERSRFPRFTIGESLLPVSLDHFEKAGLLETVLGADLMRKPGSVFHNGEQKTRIQFDETSNIKHQGALNVARGEFDLLLADAVCSRGIEIAWETTLTRAHYDRWWQLELESAGGKRTLRADFVVDASGAAIIAELVENVETTTSDQKDAAVFAHLEDPNRPKGFEAGAAWILTNETHIWAWMIPFANGHTSMGFVGSEDEVSKYGTSATERFSNLLNAFSVARTRFSDPRFVRQPKAASNYKRDIISPSGKGYCLIGNSIGFLDPILSSGIAVATESAIRAAQAIRKHFVEGEIDWKTEYDLPLLSGIKVFSDCVDTWYDGTLPTLIHNQPAGKSGEVHPTVRQINSILAGGAWDDSNPMTKDTARIMRILGRGIPQ